MPRKLSILALLIFLLSAAFFVSGSEAPKSEDLAKQYELEYQTRRVPGIEPFQVTPLVPGEYRIQLAAYINDGGCISKETLAIGPVEKLENNITAINLTYTLDGQPCKALFIRELKATLRLPGPGAYRIKLWLNELYFSNGPVLIGDKEIKMENCS